MLKPIKIALVSSLTLGLLSSCFPATSSISSSYTLKISDGLSGSSNVSRQSSFSMNQYNDYPLSFNAQLFAIDELPPEKLNETHTISFSSLEYNIFPSSVSKKLTAKFYVSASLKNKASLNKTNHILISVYDEKGEFLFSNSININMVKR
ncbi:hypothetical protein [Deinococcus aquatilis]|jgi:hypothetical protein|uniref:hypothetical protein n=1 Tax=Deinococcus aquatilis TaxID=519440 RepID=UPI0012F71655|nr:hypothetical protein [Deinococcus aquatilis]